MVRALEAGRARQHREAREGRLPHGRLAEHAGGERPRGLSVDRPGEAPRRHRGRGRARRHGGGTAAWLYGIGEVSPSPYEFCTPERKQTKRPNLIIRKRRLDPKDVAIVSDIPATRPWLTVVDLIDSGEELSLVANVLADALERGLVEDEGTLREKIDARGGKSRDAGGGQPVRFVS